MSLPWLLDVDPLSGAIETFDYDEHTDTIIIKRTCDVTDVIDRNKALQGERDGGWVGKGRDMRLAASVPLELVNKWQIENGVNTLRHEHWPALKKYLNSNEYRDLRPHQFRL